MLIAKLRGLWVELVSSGSGNSVDKRLAKNLSVIQARMLQLLNQCETRNSHLEDVIYYSVSVRQLWFIRPVLLTHLSKNMGEREASERLGALRPLFELAGLGLEPDHKPKH